MIFSKLMLIAVGAGVVNALPILTVPDAQEDRLVDLDSPASQVSIRFLNGEVDSKAVLVKYTDNGVLKQIHINANTDTASYAVDPTKEITILSDYSYYLVCKVAPGTLKEDDAVSTAVTWGNVPCKVSGPSPSPAPAPSPSPSAGLSSCAKKVPMPSGTIWKQASSSHSCESDSGIRGDTGFACANDKDVVDRSSIFVDMSATPDKVGCFVWETDDCKYSMKRVKQIDFDVEWSGCDSLWMAPLWTYSDPWSPITGLQGYSGEVDFVEECPVPHVKTNLGCYDAAPGGKPGSTDPADPDYCLDGSNPPSNPELAGGASSNGPMHMTMTIDDSGDLNVLKCNPNSCQTTSTTVAAYHNYIGKVYPTTEGRDNLYKFMSDVFNDRAGDHGRDPGWKGCKAQKNSGTNCKYAVTNIKITSNDLTPMFPPTDKCSVLNA